MIDLIIKKIFISKSAFNEAGEEKLLFYIYFLFDICIAQNTNKVTMPHVSDINIREQ